MKVFLRVVLLMVLFCSAPGRAYTTISTNLCQQGLNFHGTRKPLLSPSIQTSCNPIRTKTKIRLTAVTILFTKKKEEADALLLNTFQTPIIMKEKVPTAEELLQRKTEKRAIQFVGISAGLIVAYAGTCLNLLAELLEDGSHLIALSGPVPAYAPFLKWIGMGQFLAAGMTYFVTRAATNDRLASNTYNRLNGILALYGLLSFFVGASMIRKAQMTATPTIDIIFRLVWWMLLSVATILHSLKGYGVGVNKGWVFQQQLDRRKEFWKDWGTQTKSMMKHVLPLPPPPQNLQALVYWAASATLAFLTAAAVFQSTTTSSVLKLAQCGLLAPLTGVFIILKDAADRGSLEGTTFIGLSYLSSMTSAFVSASLRQGVLFSSTPLATWMARATDLVAGSTALFGTLGLVVKKYKHKQHDQSLLQENAMRLRDDFPLDE